MELDYDFSKIENLPDYEKRINLIKSWQGQVNKCLRKEVKDPYFGLLAKEWQKKIDGCLEGKPLEEVQGKVKVKGHKPFTKKQRVKYKKEQKAKRHQEYLAAQKKRKQERMNNNND